MLFLLVFTTICYYYMLLLTCCYQLIINQCFSFTSPEPLRRSSPLAASEKNFSRVACHIRISVSFGFPSPVTHRRFGHAVLRTERQTIR